MATALQYAQEELAPCSDNDPELLSDLERTLALLAFADLEQSPVAGLLSKYGPQEEAFRFAMMVLRS